MQGSNALSIGLTMFLRDQFSGPASRIRDTNKAMQQDMRLLQEEQLRWQRNVNAGVALAGAAATRGIARMVNQASKFGYEMEFVKSVTAATVTETEALEKLATKLGQDTMFTGKQVAEGMRFMAMAGMTAEQVSKNIAASVSLAGSTMSLLEGKGGASDIMTNIMKQFQIDFRYTSQVADILSYAVTRSNTNLFDLGEALKYSGSTAMDLSISLQESAAMVMALGNAGLQGSMAGVAMENSMRYLSKAFSSFGSGPSIEALNQLGLSITDVTDQAGNLLSMTEVMKKVGASIDRNFGSGMNIEKQAILQSIFGVRGKRAASLFLRNLQEFDQFTTDISTKSQGHSTRVMSDMMATLHGQILRVESAWENLWISFTKSVEPTAKFILKAVEGVITVFQKLFNIPIFGSMFSHVMAGFIAITTLAAGFRAVVAGIRLVYMQSNAAFATMRTMVLGGYTQMTAAANTYATAANRANLTSMAAAGGLRGIKVNSAGRMVSSRGNAFVSTAAAAGVAAGTMRMVGAKAVENSALRMGLGRVVGFLGGPWMLALTFGLPLVISALSSVLNKNRDSVEKNTNALEKSNQEEGGKMTYHSTYELLNPAMGPKLLTVQALGKNIVTQEMLGTGFSDAIYKIISEIQPGISGGDIVINIDGENMFKKPIDSFKKDFRSIGIYQ